MRGLFFLIIVCIPLLYAGADSTVTYRADGKEYVIKAVLHHSVYYLKVRSVAEAFGCKVYENTTTGKIEIKGKTVTAKFTRNNPFVVITGKGPDSQQVYQLPVSVIYVAGDYYFPAVYSLPVLNRISGTKLTAVTPTVTERKKEPQETVQKPEEPSVTGDDKETTQETKKQDTTAQSDKTKPQSGLFSREIKKNGEMIKLPFSAPYISFQHSQKGNVFVLKVKGGKAATGKESYTDGLIRSVKVTREGAEIIVQVTVSKDAAPVEVVRGSQSLLFISVRSKNFGKSTEAKKKYKFDTIVLDAGHGGKDYGAIGYEKTTEKVVNLAVALRLGEMIKKELPGIKVVYTRSDDTFIELYKRGQIANKANGKLFVSIHCNSVAGKKEGPNGYEIYLLRPGRTKEAISIAERENAVITYEEDPNRYQQLTDENFILVSMAHAAHMKFSEMFADAVDRNIKKQVSIVSRGIKQAGFYVLVGASMPSILFEIGYISSPKDSKIMRSKEGQGDIARGLLESIKEFKEQYENEMDNE